MKTNFIEKIITNLYIKIIQRKQKKEQTKKLTEQEKQKAVIYKQLKELYSFVTWLNTKGLKNRHQRKAFWRAVRQGEPVIEDVLNRLISKYASKPKPPIGRIVKDGKTQGDKLVVKEDKRPLQGHQPKKSLSGVGDLSPKNLVRPSLQGKPTVIKLGETDKK